MTAHGPLPGVIVITDWTLERVQLLSVLESLLPLGPRLGVQHRHPGANARCFLEEARLLAERCGPAGVPLFINERLDVALLLGSHLHAPAHGPGTMELRAQLPPAAWLSVAVHDEAEARAAQGADLALVSPLFAPGSKPEDTRAPLGASRWQEVARALPCPAYALGGVTESTLTGIPSCAAGVAVVSAVWRSAHPLATVQTLLAAGAARAGASAPSLR